MAATDQHYRDQKTLHIVFAVTSVAMLVSVIWMFAQDYYREFKTEQRVFRDVESEVYKRQVLAAAPTEQKQADVVAAQEALTRAQNELKEAKRVLERDTSRIQLERLRAENKRATIKADMDSVMSFINIAADESPTGLYSPEAESLIRRFNDLKAQYDKANSEVQAREQEYNDKFFEAKLSEREATVKAAEKRLKELSAD